MPGSAGRQATLAIPAATSHVIGELFLAMIGGWKINGILPAITIDAAGRMKVDQPVGYLRKRKHEHSKITNNSHTRQIHTHPLPMHRQQFRVLFGALMSTRHIAPHMPIGWQSVRRVTRQWIPALIFVDVIVVRIRHWSNARRTRLQAAYERTAPTARIHPGRVVIANAPCDARTGRLDALQVAAHLTPKYVHRWHNNSWTFVQH